MSEIISTENIQRVRKPDWLRVKLPSGTNYSFVRETVTNNKLHTICQSGNCPNMGECWGAGTATFMILGNICTRSCGFCNVATGRPLAVDWNEPQRVAESVKKMKVKHCVITCVDRDDLEDGGAAVWVMTIRAIRKLNPSTTLETLVGDFAGQWKNLDRVISEKPEVISHNLETVRRLTKQVRVQAKYDRSLEALKRISESGVRTKSGIMLGLGETKEEVLESIDDLRNAGVNVLTIGQYLQPTKEHLPVAEYVHPGIFAELKETALSKGFMFVESGPLVRSSFHAEKHVDAICK
ncbi:MAG TPA: lipoyl synthase [Bacteroidia bacterium]|nr:lipoyl synthase [Bacteroidia bacterium]